MNGGNVIFTFKGDTKDITNKTKSLECEVKGSLLSTAKLVKSDLIANAISKGMGVISNSLDGAISRLDTMNNFSKVMLNLGQSAEDSEDAIKTLSNKLIGLPTSLDAGVSAVQRFTSKNGDVKKSADIFLAVNNAILAGGASMEIQSSALEQLSQAYAKGKPDMMEWRTMLTAMPAQINQVAKAMNMSVEELGEGLRTGDIPMDEFINKILELNKTGVAEFASFEQQARNSTGGIATQITNVKTAITRGVANVIGAFDTMMTNNNLPTFSEIISIATQKINDAFSKAVDFMKMVDFTPIINMTTKLYDAFKKLSPVILTVVSSIIAYKVAMQGIKIAGIISKIGKSVGTFLSLAKTIRSVNDAVMLMNVAFSLNPIGLIIAAIIGLIAGFALLWNKCEGFRNFWIGLWEGIKSVFTAVWEGLITFFTTTIPNIITGIIDWFKKLPENIGFVIGYLIGLVVKFYTRLWQFITEDIPQIIVGIVNWFAELPGKIWILLVTTATRIAEWIINLRSKMEEGFRNIVNNVVIIFKELPGKVKDVGLNLVKGIVNGIKNAKGWAIKQIKKFCSGVVDGFKKALGIHSPSTIMFDMGINMDKGFINGMEDMQGDIQSTFDGMFDLSPNLYGNTSTNLSPNVNVVVNNNMKQDPLGRMVRDIKTFAGGSKNDYNYVGA